MNFNLKGSNMATSKSGSVKKPAAKPAAKKTAAATGKTTAKTVSTRTAISKKPATPLATTTAPAKTAAPAKKAAAKPAPASVSPEQRYKMVQDAAYFIAEKNGFASGSLDYWIAAEAEIDLLLSGKKK